MSADFVFVSRFLLSADFVFVSRFCFCKQIQKIFFVSRFVFRQQMSLHLSTKRRSRRHIHFHASLFREGNIFSSGGRAFSLQSRLHSYCPTFLGKHQTKILRDGITLYLLGHKLTEILALRLFMKPWLYQYHTGVKSAINLTEKWRYAQPVHQPLLQYFPG